MKKNQRKNRKSKKFLTAMLFFGTILVWVLMAILKYFIVGNFSWMDILASISDNLLGVLPPIIIFNFLYEYLSQEFTNDEISESITNSLMTSEQSLEMFDDDAKLRFIHSSILSLVGKEKGEMIYKHVNFWQFRNRRIKSISVLNCRY